MTPRSIRVPIREECDVAVARGRARELGLATGLREAEASALATAVSEVARNIVVHAAGPGEVFLEIVEERGRRGVVAVARDERPGIPDVALALQDGYSTSRGLGLGLPSAKRLTDEFSLESAIGRGTTVTLKKWVRDGTHDGP